MSEVGFEPTPPERVHLKCTALDRSAIPTFYNLPKKPTFFYYFVEILAYKQATYYPKIELIPLFAKLL